MGRAHTSYRIVKHGEDRMVLSHCRTGEGIVEAVRDETGKTWTLKTTADAEDRIIETGDTRRRAVDAMNDFAAELTPGSFIDVFIPWRAASPPEVRTHPHVRYEMLPDGTKVPVIHLRDEIEP